MYINTLYIIRELRYLEIVAAVRLKKLWGINKYKKRWKLNWFQKGKNKEISRTPKKIKHIYKKKWSLNKNPLRKRTIKHNNALFTVQKLIIKSEKYLKV